MALTSFLMLLGSLVSLPAPASLASANREYPTSLSVGPSTIEARVRSNGCTDKNDFRVSLSRSDGRAHLSFWRLKPDLCRALIRDGVVLTWSRAELGLAPTDSISVGLRNDLR
jgi:hypothetical protein